VRWVSEPDNGIADAMNKGVQMANGEVIAHLHSDDYYPDHSVISSVNSALEKHPGSLWLTGGMFIVNERGMAVNDIKVRDYSFKGLLSNNILLHPSTFIKKQAFEQVGGFNVSLKYAMDYDLWLRLGSICDPILLDRPLACFRVHEGSISTKEVDAAFDEAWKIRKRYLGLNIFKLFFHYNNYRKSRKINRDFVNSLRGDRQDS
jgi:glycosyltransferase involved in cell wall biosynthesis